MAITASYRHGQQYTTSERSEEGYYRRYLNDIRLALFLFIYLQF